MSRPLSERVKDPWWYLEQAAHILIGATAAAVLWVPFPILAGGLAALWVAILREVEQRPVGSWGDLAVDVACTLIGGLAIGLAVWGVS